MLKELTRWRLIQGWFAAVAVVITLGFVLGASVSLSTGSFLLALCVVPPMLLLLLWPAEQPVTVAEMLHEVDRRD